jgi:uncharacterized protein YbjQ (UPF0145 family)
LPDSPLLLLLVYGLPVALIALAFFIGTAIEKRHYVSIREREAHFLNLPVVTFDDADGQFPVASNYTSGNLVSGSVVISIDRFKQLRAALRNLFGGRVTAYESLLDRARREALLRMYAAAGDADAIANLRVETSAISGRSEGSLGTVEVHAYGTALFVNAPHTQTA